MKKVMLVAVAILLSFATVFG
ncbi:MAG: hypothetical protein JWQ66_1609, partial [Mucilaginibacter sp.]|nr:hypothetical protein [Mucilaginibacter sp.]